jgi:formate hydrogenlyase subunit 6/NADH:ubiquinone oxidoreductase subunit I
VIAPVVRDAVIAYDDVRDATRMPTGLTVDQSPGSWRVASDDSGHRFGWTPGADSWKRFVLPPHEQILNVRRRDGSFAVDTRATPEPPLAFIGARACELRALGVLDRVLADPAHPDPRYVRRRTGTFVVAVTCGVPSATCWCTSIGGSPRPDADVDVRLTEVDDGRGHRLVAEPVTARGADVLDRLDADVATEVDLAAAEAVGASAIASMPQRIDGDAVAQLLEGTELHPHWDRVAARCLSCGNCTMVCPTCFCTRIEDVTGLPSARSESAATDDVETDAVETDVVEIARQQRWASCFELDHSNLVGRPVRATTASRYRQWLTHKLQTWPAQFGTTGCVGCGRCTTWCPAAIDLVEETRVLVGAQTGART